MNQRTQNYVAILAVTVAAVAAAWVLLSEINKLSENEDQSLINPNAVQKLNK